MARLYNWDVKRRKDQKAVAANWKENLIQPKAEKKTWFSWKLKRKNMFQLKTEKTWNTRFSWSVINNSYSWSENNVQLIQFQCSADSITMFSRSVWFFGWSKYHVILIRIGVSAEKPLIQWWTDQPTQIQKLKKTSAKMTLIDQQLIVKWKIKTVLQIFSDHSSFVPWALRRQLADATLLNNVAARFLLLVTSSC